MHHFDSGFNYGVIQVWCECVQVTHSFLDILSWSKLLGRCVDKKKKRAFLLCVHLLVLGQYLLKGLLGSVLHSRKGLEHGD